MGSLPQQAAMRKRYARMRRFRRGLRAWRAHKVLHVYPGDLMCSSNVHDATETSKLLTGDEDEAYGNSGYLGAEKRGDAIIRNKADRKIKYRINRRPSQVKKLSKSGQYAAKKAEHAKSSVRAKVEHVFGVVKKQLRFRKTRYRGLEKQRAKFNIMFALANLILADRSCLAA